MMKQIAYAWNLLIAFFSLNPLNIHVLNMCESSAKMKNEETKNKTKSHTRATNSNSVGARSQTYTIVRSSSWWVPKKQTRIKMRMLLQYCVLIGKQIATWAALFFSFIYTSTQTHPYPFKNINQTAIHYNVVSFFFIMCGSFCFAFFSHFNCKYLYRLKAQARAHNSFAIRICIYAQLNNT